MTVSVERLRELEARLERATGPDRELDAEIFLTVERKRAIHEYWRGATGIPRDLPESFNYLKGGLGTTSIKISAPEYTSNIDAALTLVPEGDYDQQWSKSSRGAPKFKLWQVRISMDTVADDGDETGLVALGEHDNPAIALCIAAIKLRRSRLHPEPGEKI